MAGGQRKEKLTKPIQKIKTALSDDWDNVKKGPNTYQQKRRGGGKVVDSVVEAADEVFDGLSKTKDGGRDYFKGGAKVGGMALGGMVLLDWLFD